jgi:hypothetical protein
MIRDFADELRPRASAAAFDATIEAARAMLQERTAVVSLPGARREGEPEIRAFERIWDASDRSPEPVATATIELP